VCSLFGTNLILIALVNFVYTFVLNPTATDGCVSSRINLNSTFVSKGIRLSLALRQRPGIPLMPTRVCATVMQAVILYG
jgi:hypothetical protein